MKHEHKVAFDFDGTVIADNIGVEFAKWLAMQSWLRIFFAIPLLPLILLLTRHPLTLKLGLNIGCYIATVFQRRSLMTLRRQFVQYYFKEKHCSVYPAAIKAIKQYAAEGKDVVVVSGSQRWLVKSALKQLGLPYVDVIGSSQRSFAGGYIIQDHCVFDKKLTMAKAKGFNPEHWEQGYTDSTQDIAMMQHCHKVYLINPSKKTLAAYSAEFEGEVIIKTWDALVENSNSVVV